MSQREAEHSSRHSSKCYGFMHTASRLLAARASFPTLRTTRMLKLCVLLPFLMQFALPLGQHHESLIVYKAA